MDKTEAMKKVEKILGPCLYGSLCDATLHENHCVRYRQLLATVLVSVNEQTEKRGYRRGLEPLAIAIKLILAEQQAMPDDSYVGELERLRGLLTELVGERSKSAPWTVKLTYFHQGGKYYTEGEYQSRHSELWQIFNEAAELAREHKLPGLRVGHSDWIMLVEVPGHPHEHPFLVIPTTRGDEKGKE